MSDIIIDDEFRSLIPPLSIEERSQLEANVLAEGCRDALIVWSGVLLDGHNRYEICSERKMDFQIHEMQFNDRDEAKAWIIRNQLGRRNLQPFQRGELALKLEPLIKEKAKNNQLSGLKHNIVSPNSGKRSSKRSIHTSKELAKVARMSHSTLDRVRTIAAKAPEEIKRKLRQGETSINCEYQRIYPPRIKTGQKRHHKEKQSINSEPAVINADAPVLHPGRSKESMREFIAHMRFEIRRKRNENHDERRKRRWNPEDIITLFQSQLLDWIEDQLDRITTVHLSDRHGRKNPAIAGE